MKTFLSLLLTWSFAASVQAATWPTTLNFKGHITMGWSGSGDVVLNLTKKSEKSDKAKYTGTAQIDNSIPERVEFQVKETGSAHMLKMEGYIADMLITTNKYTPAQFYTSPIAADAVIWEQDPFPCQPTNSQFPIPCFNQPDRIKDSGTLTLQVIN
jgi:hypothetical protein